MPALPFFVYFVDVTLTPSTKDWISPTARACCLRPSFLAAIPLHFMEFRRFISHTFHRTVCTVAGVSIFWQASALGEVTAEQLPTLTSVAEIRALSNDEAAKAYPVHLQAVVTYHNSRKYCFAEDRTGAIYIMRQGQTFDLAPGELVEFEGITEPGLYAPEIAERKATVLGRTELEPPQEATLEDLVARKFHCQRVSVEGIVRAVDGKWDKGQRLDLQIEVGTGRLDVQVYDIPTDRTYDDLLDAKVRVVGMAGGKFNARREFVRPLLQAAGLESVTVEERGPADPFDLPLQAINQLLEFSARETAGRARVHGTVTYQEPGRTLFIRDETGGLLVKAQSAQLLVPGDIVDAAGLPVMGTYSPVLQQAVFRQSRTGWSAFRARSRAAKRSPGGVMRIWSRSGRNS